MPTPQLPDLLLLNGRIRTIDAHDSVATAVAIAGDRIAAVGSDDRIRSLAGPTTRVENLAGATVIPGLIDAHNHLLATGVTLGQVQLYDCRSIADIRARVADRARATPPGQWIVGRGWDESLLAERRHPTRHDLDAVAPDHPVLIHRVWNKLVANSLALRLAGIGRDTPDPPAHVRYAGSFERDEHGDPTGLLRDRAKDLLTAHLPPPTDDESVAAIALACRAYNAGGLTAVAEPGLTPDQFRAFHLARDRGALTVRTDLLLGAWGFVPPEEDADVELRLAALGNPAHRDDALLRVAGVKLMPDGGMSDRTARMFEPYPDDLGNRGIWVVDPDRLPHLIRRVHDLGWAMDIHTCGDEAQEVVVRAYAAAQTATPNPGLRHRVHHAYFPTPDTLRLMAARRIPALVSSPFLTNLGEGFVNAVGEERAARAMPTRAYLNAGVPLAGTSDSPITDFNPWIGIHAAVARRTVAGRVLGPDQSLTPAEALRSYTLGAAVATGTEAERGSIAPGKLADLVLLDRDPLSIPPDDLPTIRPLATMLGGHWVHDER